MKSLQKPLDPDKGLLNTEALCRFDLRTRKVLSIIENQMRMKAKREENNMKSNMKPNMKRREFFAKAGVAAASLTVLGTFLKSIPAQAKKLLDMTGKEASQKAAFNSAKAFGYVHDLEKALKAGKIKKTKENAGFKPNQQNCETCILYKNPKDGQGDCQIIPGVLVKGKGSCNSWAANPAAKKA